MAAQSRGSRFAARPPVGAWYNGYAGLRGTNAFDYYGYLGGGPQDQQPFGTTTTTTSDRRPYNPNQTHLNDYDKYNDYGGGSDGHLHLPPLRPPTPPRPKSPRPARRVASDDSQAAPPMAKFYSSDPYGTYGSFGYDYKDQGGYPYPSHQQQGSKDDFGAKVDGYYGRSTLPADLNLYDPYGSDTAGGGGGGGGIGGGGAAGSRLDFNSKQPAYSDPPKRGTEGLDFLGGGGGGKPFDPYPRNGPAVHYGGGSSSPPPAGGDFRGGGFGGDTAGMKQHSLSPRFGQGPTERDWELPAKFSSPRRGTNNNHYEPSFHDPGASPRSNSKPLPPWERERERDRGMADGRGQDLMMDPRAGKGNTTTYQQFASSFYAGSVFLFIRFHSDSHAMVGQACQIARTRDLKGEFVGIADKVYDFGDHQGKNRSGYAVFQFPSLRNAEVFYNRDRIIRQPDFPRPFGDVEVFAIELQVDPISVKTYKTFLLSEVTLNDGLGSQSMGTYEQYFKAPLTEVLQEEGALPYAAYCDRNTRKTLKRRFFDRNELVTLHLFRDLQHYHKVWHNERYSRLRGIHDALATEKCSLFMVRPEYT